MIWVFAPHGNEDLTQSIGAEIAMNSKTNFATEFPSSMKKILVLELGGVFDRPSEKSGERPPEIFVQDKTRTKVFEKILSEHFKTSKKMPMETDFSGLMKSGYCRLELCNKVRYNEQYRKLLVKICSDILNEVRSRVKTGGEAE